MITHIEINERKGVSWHTGRGGLKSTDLLDAIYEDSQRVLRAWHIALHVLTAKETGQKFNMMETLKFLSPHEEIVITIHPDKSKSYQIGLLTITEK